MAGPFRNILEQYFDYKKFMIISSIIVFISLIFHPLLIYIGFWLIDVKGSPFTYAPSGKRFLIWFGIISWVVFIAYDALKKYRQNEFFSRHWRTVKLLATLPLFLILFHSLSLGGDLQEAPLRYVWIFYGITAALAAAYTYGLQPFLKKE